MKVGRNDLCPCGSRKKFKKCHLATPRGLLVPQSAQPTARPRPPQIRQQFEQHLREEAARTTNLGHIRPIIQIPDHNGYRLVVVRNRLYYSQKWNFFTDFLFEYGLTRLGKDWVDEQKLLPESQQHPMFVWRRQAYSYMQKQPSQPDGSFAAVPNGPMAACNNFYYDLYTVDDNSILDDDLLGRLRHRDQFQGAMHELFVAATCLRAGFSIVIENEKDPSRRHVEFMAIHKPTDQHVLVEAKSRHRAGVLGQPGARKADGDLKFRRLINDAASKDPNNPLAIFVDTNLSFERANRFYTARSKNPLVPSMAMSAIIEAIKKDYAGTDPYNLLAFSNHPQYYSEDDSIAAGNHWAGFISGKSRVPVYRRQALTDLLTAVNVYGNVPTLFPEDRNS